jgi:ABC-type multidrug transport system fused ATPase/permease subunit
VKYVPRVLHYLKPYWQLAVAVGALIVLTGAVDLLTPWPLKILVDNVLGKLPLPEWLQAIVGAGIEQRRLLIFAVLAGLVVALIHNGLSVVNSYFQTKLDQRIVLDFRSDLFQHAQRLSLAFHDNRRSGMLIYAINNQGDAVVGLIMIVPTIVHSLITLVGMFWIVFLMDPWLALLSMMVLPLLLYSVRYYATRIQDRLMRVCGMEGESLSIVHEAMSMLRVIVAFGRESHEYQRFRDQGQQAIAARVDVTVRQTLFSLTVNMTTAVGTAAVLGYGAYQVLQGKLTVGHLLVVMAYIAFVYQPLEAITYTVGSIQNKLVQLKIAFNLLDTEPEVKQTIQAVEITDCRGGLAFENVNFNYRERTDTLKNVSFEVAPGQRVAIVGPTGAGKTTLISLIPRFYDPTDGRILLDGRDTCALTLKSLRDQISLVLQEPLLFSGNIADNIRYGRLDATEDEIIAAAQCANAHDFIMKLPQKYQTELGERGAKLSGGERQRICVARAFLKDAPILILDEPTSAIDSKTESVILDALDRLMVGRTSLMIAHRLSTIHYTDVILVLDRGQIVQRGTHEELLAQDGLYRQLHEMQTRHAKRSPRAVVAGSLAPASGERAGVRGTAMITATQTAPEAPAAVERAGVRGAGG